MAIFGSKKAGAKKAAAPSGLGDVMKTIGSASGVESTKKSPVVNTKTVIHRPRLTEKAANLSSANVYTFDIDQGATKHDVVRSIVALYKVKPVKVNVVNVAGKKMALRTRRGTGTRNNTKKAYVYLKKGDSIDFAA